MSTQIKADLNTQTTIFSSPGNNSSQPLDEKKASIKTDESEVLIQTKKSTKSIANDKTLNVVANEELKKEALTEDENRKELEAAVEVIAEFMNLPVKNINFAQDDASDKTVIKVFDSESKELIKQFPSEEVLEIAKKIAELRQDVGNKAGILLDEKV